MKKLDYLNQHKKPVTRRDFVSLGLAAGGATFFAPSLKSILMMKANEAIAQTAPSKQIPFLVFDLSGGAALFANFLVGKKNGPTDFLKSYSKLGWDPRKVSLDTTFGAPMAADVSQLLAGIKQSASASAQNFFKMSTLLHQGNVDTTSNPLSAASLVNYAGNSGQYISRVTGLKNSLSGGNSRSAYEFGQAFYVRNYADISSSAGLTDRFKTKLNVNGLNKISQILNRLSHVQASKFLNKSITADDLKMIDDKYAATTPLMSVSLDVDPRKDSVFSKIYGINPNTNMNDQAVVRASVVKTCLNRWSGPAVITIDGCDYHDGTQTTGDNKDREVGIEIGRAIEAAYQLKTPLFIQIITDGGIYPLEGTRVWTGDTVDTCMSVMGYFNPDKVPEYQSTTTQVGAYTDGQGADRSTLIGDSPLLAAYSVFANYLSVCGRSGEFKTLSKSIMTDQEHQSVLVF